MRIGRREFLLGIPAAVLAACTPKRRNASRSVTTSAVASTTTSSAPPARALPRFVQHGARETNNIALTFHGSGDVVLLDDLLAVVGPHGAKITIFAVGQWLDANPAVAHRILAGGHELANHTYTHPALATVSGTQLDAEVTRCRDALVRHAGAPGRWFRPSGIAVPTSPMLDAANAAGYATCVGYDVDPRDYQDPGADLVRSRTLADVKPGSIVSLHTGHRGTVDALGAILDELARRGLKPVTVSELLLSR